MYIEKCIGQDTSGENLYRYRIAGGVWAYMFEAKNAGIAAARGKIGFRVLGFLTIPISLPYP
jgi:hypothetical protein